MKLKFTKMHGAGNDFVVIDAMTQPVPMTPELARRLADRHRGIGCDQILLVERAASPQADFRYRIFNADGGALRVDFGKRQVAVGGAPVSITALSMGNPHAVQVVEDVEAAPVRTQGPLIEHHPRFPQRVNAGFMQIVDPHSVRLRVWERGAGETLACGTGACAAAVAGIRRRLLESPVRVAMRGGDLTIRWAGADNALNCPVWMTGPAVAVFDGEMELDER